METQVLYTALTLSILAPLLHFKKKNKQKTQTSNEFFPCLLAHRRVRKTAASMTHLEQKAQTTNSLALGLEAKKKKKDY